MSMSKVDECDRINAVFVKSVTFWFGVILTAPLFCRFKLMDMGLYSEEWNPHKAFQVNKPVPIDFGTPRGDIPGRRDSHGPGRFLWWPLRSRYLSMRYHHNRSGLSFDL